MNKTLLLISLILLIAVSYTLLHKKDVQVTETETNPLLPEITSENVKAIKKAQIEQMANDLYAETDELLKNSGPVTFDDETVYDDIEKVEVEVEVEVAKPDFGKDTLENTHN